MGALFRLPNETFYQIIEETIPDGIEGLSLSCRDLYTLVELDLPQHRAMKRQYATLDLDDRSASLPFFYFRISLNPRVALYPKTVVLRNRDLRLPATTRLLNDVLDTQAVRTMIINDQHHWLRRESAEGNEWWYLDVVLECPQICVALLLTLLVNVHTIKLEGTFYANQAFQNLIEEAVNAARRPNGKLSGPVPFRKLETVELSNQPDYFRPRGGDGFSVFAQLLTVPSVRTLRGVEFLGNFRSDPSRLGLTDISIIRSAFFEDDVITLIKGTTGLKRFTFRYGLYPMFLVCGCWHIITVLQQYAKNTLEYLELFNEARRLHWLCRREDVQYSSALRRFSVLKKRKVDYHIFVHETLSWETEEVAQDLLDCLPPALEELEFLRSLSQTCAVGLLAGKVASKKRRFPQLAKVILDCSDLVDDATGAACKQAGIALEIHDVGVERTLVWPAIAHLPAIAGV